MTDLHYGKYDEESERTTKVMNSLLDTEMPDFVAFTGDMVSGLFQLFILY